MRGNWRVIARQNFVSRRSCQRLDSAFYTDGKDGYDEVLRDGNLSVRINLRGSKISGPSIAHLALFS
jgi:hypothetical protein